MSMSVDEALGIQWHRKNLRDEIKLKAPAYEDDPIDVCNDVLAAEVRRLRRELINAERALGTANRTLTNVVDQLIEQAG